MTSKYFNDTEYVDLKEFDENRRKNDAVILSTFAPKFHGCGMILSRGNLDALPLDMSLEEDWLCQRRPTEARFPDLYCMVRGMRVAGSSTRDMFVEIKDFPRMSNWAVTGFTLYCWQTYIAAQNYADKPTAAFFKDNAERAKGTDDMPSFELRYGEEPYGALLNDLIMSPPHQWGQSFMPESGKGRARWQIRFRTEVCAKPPKPCMFSLEDFAALLRSGEVRRVILPDPNAWRTWKTAQEWAPRLGIQPMKVPKEGLVCYTSNPEFPNDDPRFPL